MSQFLTPAQAAAANKAKANRLERLEKLKALCVDAISRYLGDACVHFQVEPNELDLLPDLESEFAGWAFYGSADGKIYMGDEAQVTSLRESQARATDCSTTSALARDAESIQLDEYIKQIKHQCREASISGEHLVSVFMAEEVPFEEEPLTGTATVLPNTAMPPELEALLETTSESEACKLDSTNKLDDEDTSEHAPASSERLDSRAHSTIETNSTEEDSYDDDDHSSYLYSSKLSDEEVYRKERDAAFDDFWQLPRDTRYDGTIATELIELPNNSLMELWPLIAQAIPAAEPIALSKSLEKPDQPPVPLADSLVLAHYPDRFCVSALACWTASLTQAWDAGRLRTDLEALITAMSQVASDADQAGNDQQSAEASADQSVEDGDSQTEENSLDEDQRRLLKIFQSLTDDQTFESQDPNLINQGASNELKKELLANLEIDNQRFDAGYVHFNKEGETLAPSQRELLKVYAKVRDADAFKYEDGTLTDNALIKSEQDNWLAQEAANRPAAEIQQEFAATEPGLTVQPDAHFVDFVDPPPVAEPTAEAEPSKPVQTAVQEGDYSSLIAPAPDSAAAKSQSQMQGSIINREGTPEHDIAKYEGAKPGERDKPFMSAKAFGISLIVLLSLSLLTIPAAIRNTTKDKAASADLMNSTLRDEMRDEVPYEVSRTQDKGGSMPNGGLGTGYGGGGNSSSSETDDSGLVTASDLLVKADQLASEGHADLSAGYYEKYLRMNKRDFHTRVKLIKIYLNMHNIYQARKQCVRALKYQPTGDDLVQITQLMR